MNSEAQKRAARKYRATQASQQKRLEAFAAALEEIDDTDVRRELYDMLDGLTTYFMSCGYAPAVAEIGAVEILAACTWKGINAPRRRMKQMDMLSYYHAAQAGD
jgi:hypothetical protein